MPPPPPVAAFRLCADILQAAKPHSPAVSEARSFGASELRRFAGCVEATELIDQVAWD